MNDSHKPDIQSTTPQEARKARRSKGARSAPSLASYVDFTI